MSYDIARRYWQAEPDEEPLPEDDAIEVEHTGGLECLCLVCLAYGPLTED